MRGASVPVGTFNRNIVHIEVSGKDVFFDDTYAVFPSRKRNTGDPEVVSPGESLLTIDEADDLLCLIPELNNFMFKFCIFIH